MSRLTDLRDEIIFLLEGAKALDLFTESDFVISSRWHPLEDYSAMAQRAGSLYILGRPAMSERLTRGTSAVHESFTLQFIFIFAEGDENELETERIERHIQTVEEVQDYIRRNSDLNKPYVWLKTSPSSDNNGLPYHYMEMAKGAFCALFEIEFELLHKG